ncbi:serine/threonine protein kinase [Rothia nasimurium]|uniref:serine/threonine protein kinase n=1 Tax=Rothia nasimurium TaxID=85336 RepID=UPI001F43EAFA|nr:serine/threonine-protein kinase [Rothia nasimurium]
MSEQRTTPASWLTGHAFADRYALGAPIARGGMAEVFHAVDLWSNHPVAVKVLLPHLAHDPAQQQKFFREGNALQKIKHTNVVGVVASGSEVVRGQEVMYLVLEYVHGCTLHQLLKLRPVLSVAEMLDIMVPIVEGLSEVHAHRLVHRDFKPANVLLDESACTIKLSDFGLTRRADQDGTGELMGTPAYVAPEILDPRATPGPAADVFAVGVTMYRMLTGRMPFEGLESDQQVLYHNTNTDIPSITAILPGVSSDVAGIISWCTRRNPADRPQDATELYRALTECQEKLSPAERSYRAESADHPVTTLWEDVAEIAERSGRTRVLRSTPISAHGQATDLIDDNSDWPQVTSDHDRAAQRAADEPADIYEPTDISVGPLTAADAGYDSISGAYRRPRPTGGSQQAQASSADSGAYPAPPHVPINPRLAPEPWRPAPTPALLTVYAVLLLLGFVTASFLGWWLATFLL